MPACLPILFVALLLASPAWAAAAETPRPRLVVVVSIDQFPYEYLLRMRPHFAPDGMFRRLCDQGANFVNCNHGHAFTLTGPGHSVLLTGTFPNVTGIVDNEWFDRHSKRSVYCVEDPAYPLVGNPLAGDDEPAKDKDGKAKKPSKSKGVSPRSLLAGTLGDVLNISDPKSKVFAIALKDRAGVLMAGHTADGVFWFDSDTGNWITSSYYRESLPGYLRNFNESDAAEAYIGQQWSLLLKKEKYLQEVTEPANMVGELIADVGLMLDELHGRSWAASPADFVQRIETSSGIADVWSGSSVGGGWDEPIAPEFDALAIWAGQIQGWFAQQDWLAQEVATINAHAQYYLQGLTPPQEPSIRIHVQWSNVDLAGRTQRFLSNLANGYLDAVWGMSKGLSQIASLPGLFDKPARQAHDSSVRTRTSLRTPWRIDL